MSFGTSSSGGKDLRHQMLGPHAGPSNLPVGQRNDQDIPPPTNLDDEFRAANTHKNLMYTPEQLARLNDPNRRQRVKTKLNHMKAIRPDQVAHVEKTALEHDTEVEERLNPFTARHNDLVIDRWFDFIVDTYSKRVPPLDPSAHWHVTIIKQNFKAFLEWIVVNSKGRGINLQEDQYIGARTLRCFASVFVNQIIVRARNDHAASCGYELLKSGLYNDISNWVETLVPKYNLKRGYIRERRYFSRPEMRMVINEAIQLSHLVGREARIQLITTMLFGMFYLLRPGSMAASCVQYIQEGKFMKVGDIKSIILVDQCVWEMTIDITNWKGFNNSLEKSQTIVIHSVTKGHNALFNLCMWLLLHLLHRGLLKNIDSVEDLIKYDRAQIYFKEGAADLPMFCAVAPGGRSLLEGKPLTVPGLVSAVSEIGRKAGFPYFSLYDLRRGGARELSIIFGDKEASQALGHYSRLFSTMLRYYSDGLADADLVRTRLLETAPEGRDLVSIKERVNRNARSCGALFAMIGLRNLQSMIDNGNVESGSRGKGSFNVSISKEAEVAMENSEEVAEVNSQLKALWALMEPRIDISSCENQSVNFSEFPNATQLNGLKARHGAVITDSALLAKHEAAYRDLFKQKSALLKPERRAEKRKETRRTFEALQTDDTTDSLHERKELAQEAVDPLLQPDIIVEEAMRDDATDTYIKKSANIMSTQEFEETCVARPLHVKLKVLGLKPIASEGMDQLQPDGEVMEAIMQFDIEEIDRMNDRYNVDMSDEDRQIMADFIDQIQQVVNAGLSPDEPLGLDESEEEEQCNDVDMTHLVSCLMRFISKPITEERESNKHCESVGRLQCFICARHPRTNPPKKIHTFKGKGHLNRHVRECHSAWVDLPIDMVTKNQNEFKCPSGDFVSTTVDDVFDHCLSDDCQDQEYYKYLSSISLTGRGARNKGKKAANDNEPVDVPDEEDGPEDYVDDEKSDEDEEQGNGATDEDEQLLSADRLQLYQKVTMPELEKMNELYNVMWTDEERELMSGFVDVLQAALH